MIDLELSDDRMIKGTKLQTSEDKANKIRSGLDKLIIMKINTKNEIEEIESKLISLKENERLVRFKTEGIKELELKLKLRFEKLIFEMRGISCEMNNILVSESYY